MYCHTEVFWLLFDWLYTQHFCNRWHLYLYSFLSLESNIKLLCVLAVSKQIVSVGMALKKKMSMSVFVLLVWLTISVNAGLWGYFYLVKLKRIWIIDGENDTSVARGNERPTPSSLLSFLWLTESANKDDTWQLTRPITVRTCPHTHRKTESETLKETVRKQMDGKSREGI